MRLLPPLVLVVLALAGCASPGGGGDYVPVSTFADVHGLAASPAELDTVYVATHQGLIRGQNGSWARVGAMQDDLMGFSMHPTDASTFWTSGHPRGGGNMGVRQSTDGGLTWTTLWGESVDFHAMAVSPADPAKLWGFWRGQLHHSADGGSTWSVVGTPPPMRALAAHPANASTIYATTQSGIARSDDGGASWRPLASIPAYGVALDPDAPDTMYAGGQGALWKSTDAGATWTTLTAPGAGSFAFLSVSPVDSTVVYLASYETGVYRSGDAGATWRELKTPR